jgi:hypothetical protein
MKTSGVLKVAIIQAFFQVNDPAFSNASSEATTATTTTKTADGFLDFEMPGKKRKQFS